VALEDEAGLDQDLHRAAEQIVLQCYRFSGPEAGREIRDLFETLRSGDEPNWSGLNERCGQHISDSRLRRAFKEHGFDDETIRRWVRF
jgi:hypothetical protein